MNKPITHENNGDRISVFTVSQDTRFAVEVKWLETSVWPFMYHKTEISDEKIEEILSHDEMF